MKQKTLSQVFDQNINSEMLLWSGNDAIFGITICFHGRKMRIWLELLQKPFAEKISTILLKSIHIFCSHVGLYHSEFWKNRCMTRHFLCLAQFHTTHIAAKPNGIWSSNSSLCGTSSISSHQPRRARNWKKWNISMILQYHPSVPPPPPYLLHQWTSSNIHSQKCFTWITVPIYCLHFKKSLRHSRSLDISTKSPFKGSLFTLASQKRGTGFTSRNWNSETLGSSLVSEQESKLKFSLSD